MDPTSLDACEIRTYKKDDVILQQNEQPDGMYIIKSGEVKVERDGSGIATLEAGDFFGEMGLLLHEPRNASIRVLSEEMAAHFLSKEKFAELKEKIGEEVIAKTLQRTIDNCERL